MIRQTTYPMVFLAAVVAMCTMISMPLRALGTDAGIASSFEQTYVYRTFLKDDTIKTEAKDGVVTLTGTVAEESHKTLAQETMASLPGVIRVDNQLASDAEVTAENADKWIGRKVKLALLFHRSVSYGNTTVEVNDGIVTLKGEASSVAQKELSSEYANDIDGVKQVNNEMTVAATPQAAERTVGEKMDDASITAQVKMALWTHRSTSTVETKVVTRDGAVGLTGIAKNAAEKALVTKLVNDVQGVTSVNNEMTVKETK